MTPDLPAIEACLWPRGRSADVWMILDGARDRRIYGALLDTYLNCSCLYSGPLAPELELAAPYLVQLEYEERDTRRLIGRAWGNSWGVFLRCDAAMAKLRRHLRSFLIVRDARGGRLVFRYYDPRVLRAYLPTCTREELRTVYGPIGCFWAEDAAGEHLLEFRFDGSRLAAGESPVVQPAEVGAAV